MAFFSFEVIQKPNASIEIHAQKCAAVEDVKQSYTLILMSQRRKLIRKIQMTNIE